MSNLYKQRYVVTDQNQCRIINSNEILNAKLEELMQSAPREEEFVEGLDVERVSVEEVIEEMPLAREISIDEIRKEADEIIQGTNQQAEKILEDARKQAEILKEDARMAGERAGYETGQQRAMQEILEQKQKLEEQKMLLEEEYQKKCDEIEPQIVNVVCDVIKKVFPIQFDQTDEIILHLVKNTMLKVGSTKKFRVRVSEENYPYIESNKEQLLGRMGHDVQLTVEVDTFLNKEQCIIETESGFFNCGIDIQLDNLMKAIRSLSV